MGEWWIPDKPTQRVSGLLKFDYYKGAILDLIGSLRDEKESDQIFQPEIILGSSNGKAITLHECFEIKHRASMSSPSWEIAYRKSTFLASTVYVGAHFENKDSIKFRKLLVHYSNLDEWVWLRWLDIDFPDSGEVVIKCKKPESIEAIISEGCKVSIDIQLTYPTFSMVQKEASIKQRAYIRIEFEQDTPFNDFLQIVHRIAHFLSLGVTEPIYPLHVIGMRPLPTEAAEEGQNQQEVEIFMLLGKRKGTKTVLPFDMFFTLRDIQNNFEVLLHTWFEKADKLQPVYDLYFAALYNPSMYIHHAFLSFVQAVEAYHRRDESMIHYAIPQKDYDRITKKLIDAIQDEPKEYKLLLENKFSILNQPLLSKRIMDIRNKFSDMLGEALDDKSIYAIARTRTTLTHQDETIDKKGAKGEQLYDLTLKLKLLIEVCLLAELGFNPGEIKKAISKVRWLRKG